MSKDGTREVAAKHSIITSLPNRLGPLCDALGQSSANEGLVLACQIGAVVPPNQDYIARAFDRAAKAHGCVYWIAKKHKFNDSFEPRTLMKHNRYFRKNCWN